MTNIIVNVFTAIFNPSSNKGGTAREKKLATKRKTTDRLLKIQRDLLEDFEGPSNTTIEQMVRAWTAQVDALN